MQDTQIIKRPLVSFVIPYYNLPADMLVECIESILALSVCREELEIIIIDDGSEINLEYTLKKFYKDIIYIRKKNEGVSVARNVGINASNGEYIQFIDGDDSLNSFLYSRCLNILKKEKPDMIMFGFCNKRHNQQKCHINGPFNGVEYIIDNNIRAAVWGYVFKKELVSGLSFIKGIDYGEDEIFTPQLLLRARRLFYTDAKIYFYRIRENSAINSKGKRNLIKRLNDIEFAIYYLYNVSASLQNDSRNALLRRVHQLTMDYIYNIIVLTHSSYHLEKRVCRLLCKNMFPLPKRKYTYKYGLFRIIVNNVIGRRILVKLLLLLNIKR